MAWYSLYKWFIPWRKIPYNNRVSEYKTYLYSTWFDSLSEEERQNELYRISEQKEKRKRETKQSLYAIGRIFQIMGNSTHGRMSEYMENMSNMKKISTSPSKYW